MIMKIADDNFFSCSIHFLICIVDHKAYSYPERRLKGGDETNFWEKQKFDIKREKFLHWWQIADEIA